jgi:hypothetical protein
LLRLHDAYLAAATAGPSPESKSPSIAATAETPPIPESILIVWTDGAITAVPVNRENR